MKKIRIILLLCLFQGSALCAQNKSDTLSYKEILNISYLEPDQVEVDSLQQLNLVLPEGIQNPPLLLWIGGGAWSFVNRHVEMNLARKFAREGIAVASVGHRLSKGSFSDAAHAQGIKHPAHIEDVAAAFNWLYRHAAQYGYDPNHIIVGGFSSGAHLAALLAVDEKYLAKYQLDIKTIKAIIPVAGTYDINHYYSFFSNHENPQTRRLADTHVKDVFGDGEADFTDASPVTYLDNLEVPMLLISEGDLFNYTKHFEEKLWASKYRNCQILHVFNLGHGSLWRNISLDSTSQTRTVMIDFIRRNALDDRTK